MKRLNKLNKFLTGDNVIVICGKYKGREGKITLIKKSYFWNRCGYCVSGIGTNWPFRSDELKKTCLSSINENEKLVEQKIDMRLVKEAFETLEQERCTRIKIVNEIKEIRMNIDCELSRIDSLLDNLT